MSYAGNYAQPITSWWSQKLTMSRATRESCVKNGNSLGAYLVTGLDETPFPVIFPDQNDEQSD